jgi:hypothetical protein
MIKREVDFFRVDMDYREYHSIGLRVVCVQLYEFFYGSIIGFFDVIGEETTRQLSPHSVGASTFTTHTSMRTGHPGAVAVFKIFFSIFTGHRRRI